MELLGDSGPLQACKIPCRRADTGCGLTADICIPVSKILEVSFPQGNWRGESEIDSLQNLMFQSESNGRQGYSFKVTKFPSIALQQSWLK